MLSNYLGQLWMVDKRLWIVHVTTVALTETFIFFIYLILNEI